MHIPDNFLSTPVWVALDAISIPAAGLMVRRAGREMEDTRVPLMGVMGAFVFAAQMINFPVGLGTSSHLVGGALLAYILGPAAATVAMTAIVAVLGSIEKLNPTWSRKPAASGGKTMAAVAAAAVLLAVAGFMLASTAPDGLQRLGLQLGLGGGSGFHAPLAD